MSELDALIERVSKLTGPDREVDALLAEALLDWSLFWVETYGGEGQSVSVFVSSTPEGWIEVAPALTASLDATIALQERVLPGWDNSSIREGTTHFGYVWHPAAPAGNDNQSKHPVRAIALLLAILRALQAKPEEQARGQIR